MTDTQSKSSEAMGDPDYNRLEHLKMIQSIIERLSRQSASLKGFTITVSAGLLALYFGNLPSNTHSPSLLLIGLCSVLAFYLADAYYNGRGIQYWKLYNNVCGAQTNAEWEGCTGKNYPNFVIYNPTNNDSLLIGLWSPFYLFFYLIISVGWFALIWVEFARVESKYYYWGLVPILIALSNILGCFCKPKLEKACVKERNDRNS